MQSKDGAIRFRAEVFGSCSEECVFPVLLVPNRMDGNFPLRCALDCGELRLSLAGEAVADSQRQLWQRLHLHDILSKKRTGEEKVPLHLHHTEGFPACAGAEEELDLFNTNRCGLGTADFLASSNAAWICAGNSCSSGLARR